MDAPSFTADEFALVAQVEYHCGLPRSKQPSVALGAATVVLTVTGWASVPLFLRHFADLIDPWTSNGWRYGFSALVWLPVLIIAGMRGATPKGLWRIALIPSIVNTAGQVCFTAAHYVIDPALLTFGLRCQLVFVAIGAWIMFPRERAVIRTPGYLIGAGLLVLGMLGVLLLDAHAVHVERSAVRHSHVLENVRTLPGQIGDSAGALTSQPVAAAEFHEPVQTPVRGSPAAHFAGVMLAIGSGLLFACYGLSVRKYMEGVNPVLAFATICQYTAAALVVLMLMFGRRAGLDVLSFSGGELAKLLISALIGIAIGHVFYYISIARLGVAVTAGVLQLQPFLVAIGSMKLFDERLTSGQWIGGCIAVVGALLMLYVQWRKSRRMPSIEEPVAIAEGEAGA